MKALQLKRSAAEKQASMSMEQKVAEWNKKSKAMRAEWSCAQCTFLNPVRYSPKISLTCQSRVFATHARSATGAMTNRRRFRKCRLRCVHRSDPTGWFPSNH